MFGSRRESGLTDRREELTFQIVSFRSAPRVERSYQFRTSQVGKQLHAAQASQVFEGQFEKLKGGTAANHDFAFLLVEHPTLLIVPREQLREIFHHTVIPSRPAEHTGCHHGVFYGESEFVFGAGACREIGGWNFPVGHRAHTFQEFSIKPATIKMAAIRESEARANAAN